MRRSLAAVVGAGLVSAAAAVPLIHHASGTAQAVPRPRQLQAHPGDDIDLPATVARTTGAAARSVTAPSPSPTPTPTTTTPAIRSIVALGDSVTAGEAQKGDPFPEIVGQRLSTPGAAVHVANLGAGGLTASQLRTQVLGDASTRAAIGTADVVIVTIGANDLAETFTDTSDQDCDDACIKQGVTAVQSDVTTLLKEVRSLAHHPGARVLVTTYWNVGVDGAVAHAQEDAAYYAWTDRVTRAVNAALGRAAAATSSEVVDLYTAFKGPNGTKDPTSLLAADGDHPDEAGHRAIADAVMAALTR